MNAKKKKKKKKIDSREKKNVEGQATILNMNIYRTECAWVKRYDWFGETNKERQCKMGMEKGIYRGGFGPLFAHTSPLSLFFSFSICKNMVCLFGEKKDETYSRR
jgi:hypothetical protein